MSSLFSKIIAWEISSYKLYENEYVFAFLDIFPQQAGHTLIVPKIEIDHFSEVPEPYYSAIFSAAKKLAQPIQKATNCARICTSFVWYEVPHCHYHLIPTNSIEDFWFFPQPQETPENLKEMQKRIINNL